MQNILGNASLQINTLFQKLSWNKHYQPFLGILLFIYLTHLFSGTQWSPCVLQGLWDFPNDQFCIIWTLWIFYLLLSASLLQEIFFKNYLCVKKIKVKFGSLFWGHKSRSAFLLTVTLPKVLWTEFGLVSAEEKYYKIYTPFPKSWRNVTHMLLNSLNKRKQWNIFSFVAMFLVLFIFYIGIVLNYWHYIRVCQDASYKQMQFTMTLRQHDVYVVLH